jgi:vanillate monooxygenase
MLQRSPSLFPRNYWYASAWSHEIERRPLSRRLLNEPVVFFRKQDGAVVALEDHCPHRGYPLHKARVIGDTLECGYHGMTFNCSGHASRCQANRRFHLAPLFTVTPFSRIGASSGFGWATHLWPIQHRSPTGICWPTRLGTSEEKLLVNCAYKLIIDNLLDLSHLAFVHPRTLGTAAKLDEVQIQNKISEDSVTVAHWLIDIEPPPTYARGGFKGNVDRWQITSFEPPAFVSLYAGAADTGAGAPEGNLDGGIGLHTFNAMTPETDTTTHYFWAIAQDRAAQTENLTDSIFGGFRKMRRYLKHSSDH